MCGLDPSRDVKHHLRVSPGKKMLHIRNGHRPSVSAAAARFLHATEPSVLKRLQGLCYRQIY